MTHPRIATGLVASPNLPMSDIRMLTAMARLYRLDSVFVYDHFEDLSPSALWDRDFTWFARRVPSPHALFEYQTLLGSLAARAGRMQLGVGVTKPIGRHPVLIAQAALTLAHLTRRAPILGIGTGERMNIEPYGLPGAHAVDRLEEALQIIRRCFTSQGPIDFAGEHFRLEGAVMDLQPPPGRTPEIWIAAHGPRMLGLTGRYGDGWAPVTISVASPEDYRSKLAQIHAAATEAGRDPEAITPALFAYIAVAPTERKVRALLTSRLLRYFALLFPADRWREVGEEHPFGAQCRGFVDIVPERYDRATLEDAIAMVPPEVIRNGFLVGTPEQVIARLRQFGDAGLRHVVLVPMSAFITVRDFVYAGWAVRRIARSLRTG
jgi:phthiodiolone/phenolphthiodiolone dimycocerosates ketoreductase